MHGRGGQHRTKRRAGRKTLSDLAFLMTYINGKVEAAGAMEEEISLWLVDNMFVVVADEFQGGQNAQKHWESVVQNVRRVVMGNRG